MHCWTSVAFVEVINRLTYPHGNEVRSFPRNQVPVQDKLFVEPQRPKFALHGGIDLVIEGPCSTIGLMLPGSFAVNDTYPMGRSLLSGDGPRSWLHEILKQAPDTKKVLIFPKCCGNYPNYYPAIVRRVFPNIEWIFPSMPDLYDGFISDDSP